MNGGGWPSAAENPPMMVSVNVFSLSLSLLSRAHAHTFAFFYTRVDFF